MPWSGSRQMRSTCATSAGRTAAPVRCGRCRRGRPGGAVQHLAVHVELPLPGGGVAHAHRLRAVPAGQMRQLALLDLPAAIDAVHDPHLVRRPGDRAQQPLQPGRRLPVEPGVQQRRQGEGGIAQPAVAVVPVHGAAGLLRQAERGRGDDAARRQVGQRPQRQQRALHRLRPIGRLVEAADPVSPPARRVVRRAAGSIGSGAPSCDGACCST